MVMLVEYKGGSGGHSFDVDIDEADLPSRGEAVGELSKPVTGIHARAKRIPPEMTAQALDNEPFEDYPRAVYGYKRLCGAGGDARDRFNQSYRHGIEHFLRRTFHGLTFVPGISFDIGEILEQQEREALKAVRDRYYSANMRRQVKSLEESYDGLCALRSVFGSASQKNCFSMETVVPTRYLPELLVAAPVWFIQEKRKTPQHFVGAGSSTVRYFCDLGVTDEFAYLFQMYNNGQRLFSEFEGRDVMPLPIAELVGKVRKLFDYLVIATPYHDIASAEWRDAQWIRNIDPFLFGFLKQIPELMFFLGRWSGTGLFPLMGDMIADTMEHIKKNKLLLVNVDERRFSWYKTDHSSNAEIMMVGPRLRPVEDYKAEVMAQGRPNSEQAKWRRENHALVKFADKILRQFERGTLFSWLRGEKR